MPSIALRGLVKAESVHTERQTGKRASSHFGSFLFYFILFFLCRGSKCKCNCCGLFALTLF